MSLEAARLLLGSLPLLTETKTNKQEVGFPLTSILGEIIILLNSANLGEDRRATMYHILSYDEIKRLKLLVSFQQESRCTQAPIISVNVLDIY